MGDRIKIRHISSGSTLTEVLIALVILSIMVLGNETILLRAVQSATQYALRADAYRFAESYIDSLQAVSGEA